MEAGGDEEFESWVEVAVGFAYWAGVVVLGWLRHVGKVWEIVGGYVVVKCENGHF